MPRRRRGLLDGVCYHVTHRCHGREFLLRFARDRGIYCEMMRRTMPRFGVDVLNYVVTSNHVHLLVWLKRADRLPPAMQALQGDFAQYYNQRKSRQGAFWLDRYHTTLIESGAHLGRCLFYIDLNMVRAGVVAQPSEWPHGGHHELAGTRTRYRILNLSELRRRLGQSETDAAGFQSWYTQTLADRLAAYHVRQPYWTEAFAVGSRPWLAGIHAHFGFTRKAIRSAASETPPGSGVADPGTAYYIEGC